MGAIVILVVYLLTSFPLPVFMWRRHRPVSAFSATWPCPPWDRPSRTFLSPSCASPASPPYDTFPYIAPDWPPPQP
jgi:hypothetical protein